MQPRMLQVAHGEPYISYILEELWEQVDQAPLECAKKWTISSNVVSVQAVTSVLMRHGLSGRAVVFCKETVAQSCLLSFLSCCTLAQAAPVD